MTKIGWDFVSWSGDAQPCNVPACRRMVNSGHVRVDRKHPENGDPVVCVECWFKISLGIDPDPDATVPEWANGQT